MFSTNRAPILQWHQHYLQMNQNEIPRNPRHLGVPSGSFKTTSEAMVRSAQTCTYLASRLAISFNGLDRASTWASSPRSTIRCVQIDFWGCGTFGVNRAPILRQDYHYLQTNWIKHPLEPRHLGEPSGASKMISKPTVRLVQTLHLSCFKISNISNELNQASTWASSHRSTIGCVQNDF
jgi:hypothetical protein